MEIMRVFRRDSVGALVVREDARLRPRGSDAARVLLAIALIVLVALVAMLGSAPEADAGERSPGEARPATRTGHSPSGLDVERIPDPRVRA